MKLPADQAIADVRATLTGLPVFIAGSSVGAAMYAHISDEAYDDVDVFCASINALVTSVNKLEAQGFEMNDRFKRVFHRWMKYGTKSWHTNSIKLTHPLSGVEVNVVYKLVDGHATTSLAQVIESFDFGLLAIGGWDLQLDTYHDMRSFLFPAIVETNHYENKDPLPMLPLRHEAWSNGFISQYQGVRQAGRLVKYIDYGYDMSLVQSTIIHGYYEAASYLLDRDRPEKQALGKIYETIAGHLEAGNYAKIKEATREVDFIDSLDLILEALE